MNRRTAIAGSLAMLAVPAGAKLPRGDREIKASPIRWPSDDGTLLHGFMAIPARAKGKQPAVLILARTSGTGDFDIRLTVALAQAGLIGCAPEPSVIGAAVGGSERALADLAATIGWLAHHAYATGAVGLLATRDCADVLAQLAPRPNVAAAVLFGQSAPPAIAGAVPILALPDADAQSWEADWGRAVPFLREHLR